MVEALSDKKLESETASLGKFHDSVRVRASEVTSAAGKQQVIRELYKRFFQKAFREQAEAPGIAYTPVEIVDYILRAADYVSRKHFGCGVTDKNTHVLETSMPQRIQMRANLALAARLVHLRNLERHWTSKVFDCFSLSSIQ